MKLRLRSTSGRQALVLEAGATVACLKAAAGLVDEDRLSLNNRDPLRGEPGTQLHNLGVKSGDLLYVLPSQQGQAPAESTAGACAAAPEPKRMRDGGVNGPAVQPQQDPPRQPQAEAEQSPATVEVQLLPPTQLPACLRNTLEKNCSSKALVWPADVLLLAAHAAMLDAQFVPSWAVAFGSDAVARLHVPASCRLSRTTWRITYHLVLAGAAGGQAGGTDGRGSSNAGAVRQHESGTCVVLHSSSIGSGGVVLAVSAQHHARHVSLHAASYVQPMRPSVVGATNGACGLTPSGTAVLPTGGDGGLVIGDHWLSPLAARRLWTTLKDSLAVPMMFAAFAEAGLPPPAGLLALPVELKERLLKLLGPHDLAALCCTCSELRHLATLDDLWRPLFEQEFPPSTARRLTCYHLAFGSCWTARRQREEELRRARRFVPAVPHFSISPHPLFYPQQVPTSLGALGGPVFPWGGTRRQGNLGGFHR